MTHSQFRAFIAVFMLVAVAWAGWRATSPPVVALAAQPADAVVAADAPTSEQMNEVQADIRNWAKHAKETNELSKLFIPLFEKRLSQIQTYPPISPDMQYRRTFSVVLRDTLGENNPKITTKSYRYPILYPLATEVLDTPEGVTGIKQPVAGVALFDDEGKHKDKDYSAVIESIHLRLVSMEPSGLTDFSLSDDKPHREMDVFAQTKPVTARPKWVVPILNLSGKIGKTDISPAEFLRSNSFVIDDKMKEDSNLKVVHEKFDDLRNARVESSLIRSLKRDNQKHQNVLASRVFGTSKGLAWKRLVATLNSPYEADTRYEYGDLSEFLSRIYAWETIGWVSTETIGPERSIRMEGFYWDPLKEELSDKAKEAKPNAKKIELFVKQTVASDLSVETKSSSFRSIAEYRFGPSGLFVDAQNAKNLGICVLPLDDDPLKNVGTENTDHARWIGLRIHVTVTGYYVPKDNVLTMSELGPGTRKVFLKFAEDKGVATVMRDALNAMGQQANERGTLEKAKAAANETLDKPKTTAPAKTPNNP